MTFFNTNKVFKGVLLLSLALSHQSLANSRWHHNLQENRDAWYTKGEQINTVFPKGTSAFIIGSPELYYFSNLNPSYERRYGYGFLNNFKIDIILSLIDDAEHCIIDREKMNSHLKFLKSPDEIEMISNKVKTEFKLIKKQDNGLEFWKRIQ